MDLAEKLEKYTDKSGYCWIWKGRFDRGGYGIFRLNGKSWKAHRASYAAHVGPLPQVISGTRCCVLHRCDNPSCVNPVHLFLGSQAENMTDKMLKGRAIGAHSGELHHCAKLTVEKVAQIRAEPHRRKEFSILFGVDRKTIYKVIKGITWVK